jgi:hypothetical protein
MGALHVYGVYAGGDQQAAFVEVEVGPCLEEVGGRAGGLAACDVRELGAGLVDRAGALLEAGTVGVASDDGDEVRVAVGGEFGFGGFDLLDGCAAALLGFGGCDGRVDRDASEEHLGDGSDTLVSCPDCPPKVRCVVHGRIVSLGGICPACRREARDALPMVVLSSLVSVLFARAVNARQLSEGASV